MARDVTRDAGWNAMYGLIGKIRATQGDRDRLAEILINGLSDMPGCLSYVVARDPADADVLWVTEVWTSREHHAASLELPRVQAAIDEPTWVIGETIADPASRVTLA